MSTNRRTLYLRPKKDQDILDYIEPLLEQEEFAPVIRGLVRDGIKFRSGAPRVETRIENKPSIQSNTPKLPRIELKQKELTNSELENRLDNF
jgi:hypothetical protein